MVRNTSSCFPPASDKTAALSLALSPSTLNHPIASLLPNCRRSFASFFTGATSNNNPFPDHADRKFLAPTESCFRRALDMRSSRSANSRVHSLPIYLSFASRTTPRYLRRHQKLLDALVHPDIMHGCRSSGVTSGRVSCSKIHRAPLSRRRSVVDSHTSRVPVFSLSLSISLCTSNLNRSKFDFFAENLVE